MGKKHTTYSEEFGDLFQNTKTKKQTEKVFRHFKNAQFLAYPKQGYKDSLKSRLSNIYTLENSGMIKGGFSFKYFIGIMTSFVFISGVSFIVYDTMKTSILDTVYEESMQIETSISDKDILEGISFPIEKKYDENKGAEIQRTSVIETGTDISSGVESIEEAGNQDINRNITEKIHIGEVEDSGFSSKKMIEQDPDASEASISPNSGTEDSTDFSEPSIPIGENESMIMPEMMIDGDFTQAEDSQGIYEYHIEIFQSICEENKGVISPDGYTCTFATGLSCHQDNIQKESIAPCEALYGKIERDESSIFLEELIENYGQ